jgi:hypothetical protein
MIGASGSISTLVSSERLYRENPGEGANRLEKNNESGEASGVSDSVSLSPAALALARNVPPAGESSENGSSAEAERQPESAESLRMGSIDIRV